MDPGAPRADAEHAAGQPDPRDAGAPVDGAHAGGNRVNGSPHAPEQAPDHAPHGARPGADEPEEQHPARALTLHILRMLETRMDAAGIAIQSEIQSFSMRLQLKIVAGAAVFFAIWGGIVLLAIALPERARVPVLAGVVVLFVAAAVWAHLASRRRIASREVGSMHWFLESLKLDLDVLSRSLSRVKSAAKGDPVDRSPPRDLAH